MAIVAKNLPRDRFTVEVAALTRLGPFEQELRDSGIPVSLIGKAFKLDPFCLRRLTRFLKAGKFDIVQTWIFAANTYGRVAARLAKTPVVITTEMAVDLWKNNRQFAIDRRLARWTDAVVGNSQAVVDFYKSKGVPEEKLVMIHSGIELDPAPMIDKAQVRASLNTPLDVPVVLFAGRLAEQKGVADLLFAMDLLQQVMPQVKTWIAGDGPLRKDLEARSANHRLDGKVQFLGHREDVPALLLASDMLVLPSTYEGLPNIVLEAMMFGTPVVACAAPGTTEVIDDGVTGLLTPPGKPSELTRAIRKLILDPELGKRLAAAAKEKVEKDFSAQAMIDQFVELYERLAREKVLGKRTS